MVGILVSAHECSEIGRPTTEAVDTIEAPKPQLAIGCHEPACDYGPTLAVERPRPTKTSWGSRSRDKAIHVRTLYMFRHVNIHNMYAVITATI